MRNIFSKTLCKPWLKRVWLGGLLLFPWIFQYACAQPVSITLALDWSINPNHAPILIAEQEGYFQQEGLSVHLLTPTETEEPLRLVLAHQAQVAISYPTDLVLAQARHLPIQQIGTLIDHSVNALAVLQSRHLSDLKALEGQKIGVSGGATGSALLKVMLQHAGVDLQKIQFETVQMGLTPTLLSGRVAAVWGFSTNVEPVLLKASGHPVSLFLPEQYGLPSIDGYIFIDEKGTLTPHVEHALMRAIGKGVAFIRAHPQKAWTLLVQKYPTALAPTPASEAANHQVFEATLPLFSAHPQRINLQKQAALQKFMISQGIVH